MSGFDVTEHEMVPDHVVLDDEEVEELTERYDIRPTDLPKISEKDAAARQVDASPGDVLKVVRESYTTDEAVAYRIVVED